VILVNKDLGVSLTNIKFIGLTASILNLFLSLIIFILFDFSLNQFQFVQEYHEISYFNFFLGIDGLSIYFVVRPLTKKKPVPLRIVTELMLCKPTNLLDIEMIRGKKHVSKVLNKIKYKFYLVGKVIYIQAFIIMLLQNYRLTSKILDTKIHSFARPALFTLQQKMRLYPNFTKSGFLQSVKYSTTSGASKDLSNISPKFYENADTQKLEILKDNQNKSGIYQWVNKINGKTYIGSSKNLGKRLRDYFNVYFLVKKIEKGKSMIYNSLLKKGYSNFTLEILEYCDSADLLKREQYYIDKLNPEYNILKTAGSSLGFKHSDETRAKISNSLSGERHPMFGLKHSDEIRAKISNSLSGERNPMFGKTESQSPRFGKRHSSETREKISIFKAGKPRPQGAGKSSQPVEVIDIKNNIKTRYDSISAAALALGIKSATISKYFSNGQKKPYNSQYVFCRRYSSLSQSLAIMKHTKCNHKCVEKQNAYLSSWLLKGLLPLKQWAKNIISDFFLGTGDPLSLVIGIKNLTLKLWALKFENFTKISALFNTNSKGDGVIVVQSHMLLEGSQETVVLKNKAGNTLHFIRKRPKTYGYNPYDTIHLNSRRTLVQKIFTLFLFILFLVLTTHASSYIMGDITGEFVLFSAAVPIKFYANADSKKLIILKENAGKSGVYRWVNQVNGKSYIGSAVNLSIRLRNYFNINYLLLHNMRIYKALLKYGHSKFDLEILEYCEPTQCIEREQYFMDLFHPHYNILNTAGSLLGLKHSDQSRANISKSLTGEKNPMYGKIGEMNHMFGREISEQTLAKLSKSLTGEKNPRYGKKKPEGSGSPSIKVKVLDILTGISTIYCSISEAAKALKCPSSSISVYFLRKRQTPIFFYKKKIDIYWKNWSNANKNRASRGKTLHSISLLRAKTFDYNSNNSIHLNFSTLVIRHMSTEVSKKCNINPWFLTGFSDAEGCFMVSIYKSPKSRVGWRVQPVFQIGLHPKDKELLNIIQTYFDGQGILTRLKDNCLTYRVFSLETLDKIIEHFEKYPLQTQKRGDFELFKSVVMMVKCGKHLNTEGLQEIINYRASLNNGLTPILKEAFPNFILIPRFHKIVNPQVPDPHWLSGFTAGEGCFNINIVKNSSTKTGYLVNLRFQLSQHLRNENLLKSFIDYFGCGKYYTVEGVQSRGDFVVTRLSDILNKIIPFYLNYPIMGIKAKDFQSWYEASELMFKKEHLTLEGLEKILKIKASKNNTPKTRKQ